jgi:hypothetical protein
MRLTSEAGIAVASIDTSASIAPTFLKPLILKHRKRTVRHHSPAPRLERSTPVSRRRHDTDRLRTQRPRAVLAIVGSRTPRARRGDERGCGARHRARRRRREASTCEIARAKVSAPISA